MDPFAIEEISELSVVNQLKLSLRESSPKRLTSDELNQSKR